MRAFDFFLKFFGPETGVSIVGDQVVVNDGGACVSRKLTAPLRLDYTFDAERKTWVLLLQSGGHRLLSREFGEIDFDSGKRHYNALMKQMSGGGRPSGFRRLIPWVGGAVLMYGALTGVGLVLMDETSASVGAEPAAGHQIAQAPVSQAEPKLVMLTSDELAKVKGANMFYRGLDGGKFAYVFTDPLCPACKQLDREINQAESVIRMAMVPVAFKTGSDKLAAQVLCSKEPEKVWQEIASSGFSKAPVCEAGLEKVKANNELFLSLGLGETPTLVSSTGALAVGSAPASDLIKWVEAF